MRAYIDTASDRSLGFCFIFEPQKNRLFTFQRRYLFIFPTAKDAEIQTERALPCGTRPETRRRPTHLKWVKESLSLRDVMRTISPASDPLIENVDKISTVLKAVLAGLDERKKEITKQESESLQNIEAVRLRSLAEVDRAKASWRETMSAESERLEREKTRIADETGVMERVHKFQSNRVRLDVGGMKFTTSLTTLTSDPTSMLAIMFSGRHRLVRDRDDVGKDDVDGVYFIDRDGTHFRHVLNYLRDGGGAKDGGCLPRNEQALRELLVEAEFYQLTGLQRLIRDAILPVMGFVSQAEINACLADYDRSACKRFVADGSGSHTMLWAYRYTKVPVRVEFVRAPTRGLDLREVHFTSDCSFRGAVLRNSDFSYCFFDARVDFSYADLRDCTFWACAGLISGNANFTGALLDGVRFSEGVESQLTL